MKIFENSTMKVIVENGIITQIYDKNDKIETNLADIKKSTGSVGYTLKSEDIKLQQTDDYRMYEDRECVCTEKIDDTHYKNNELQVYTEYEIDEDGIKIHTYSDNDELSQFGVNLDLNFLNKKGTNFRQQLLPTSSYSSKDMKYNYCVMTRPNGRAVAVVAESGFKGFRIVYSSFCFAHFIQRYQILSSYDKAFGAEDKKDVSVKIMVADSTKQAFKKIRAYFGVPYCDLVVGGNFGGNSYVKCSADTEYITVNSPNGNITKITDVCNKTVEIPTEEEGFYSVVPFNKDDVSGMDVTLWYCDSLKEAFDRSALAIAGDKKRLLRNSCEGGIYLWTKLCNMRINGNESLKDSVMDGFSYIIGDVKEPTVGGSILPYNKDENIAYRLFGSDRVQNGFFISSYLLEAYRVFKDKYYLEYAVSIMLYLVGYRIVNGCVMSTYSAYADYTTVCAPIINLIDLSNELKALADDRYKIFEKAATDICEHLIRRGWDFPTECSKSDETEPETEDGSISCTALSLLYYCANVQYVEKYFDFANQVLDMHKAWSIYSPDVRQYRSSFRWWETIWEGDAHGPTINAGHAWTIWRAEALFYLGMLSHNQDVLLDSWNSYMTNYCKIRKDGKLEACYEPDFVVNHASSDNDYQPWHKYPVNPDESLAGYVWPRSVSTWLKTCAFMQKDGQTLAMNVSEKDGVYEIADEITTVFVGDFKGTLTLECKDTLKIALGGKKPIVHTGINEFYNGTDLYITADNGVISIEF